jgi:hypothetical protein
MSADPRPIRTRIGGTAAVVALFAVNCGLSLRFWKSLFNRPDPQFTLDWTPLVYWAVGMACAVITLLVLHGTGARLSIVQRRTLVGLGAVIFIG